MKLRKQKTLRQEFREKKLDISKFLPPFSRETGEIQLTDFLDVRKQYFLVLFGKKGSYPLFKKSLSYFQHDAESRKFKIALWAVTIAIQNLFFGLLWSISFQIMASDSKC